MQQSLACGTRSRRHRMRHTAAVVLDADYRALLTGSGITGAHEISSLTPNTITNLAVGLARIIEQNIFPSSSPTQRTDRSGESNRCESAEFSTPPLEIEPTETPLMSQLQSPVAMSVGEIPPAKHTRASLKHCTSDMSLKSLLYRPEFIVSTKVSKTRDAADFSTLNGYAMIYSVGRGTYGDVQLAVDKETSELRAIKIISKSLLRKLQIGADRRVFENFRREVAIMKKLRHRNVIILREVIDDPNDSKMYMVMDYHEGGAVAKMKQDGTCKTYPEDKVKKYVRQAASGLAYVHRHAVLHRDIKPDNLLIATDDRIVITDFGVSEALAADSPKRSTTKGTPAFLAPELLTPTEYLTNPVAVDVWALGVTMFCLLYGFVPFGGETFLVLSENIRDKPPRFPPSATFEQQRIISGLLRKDPANRMSLNELRFDPYFADLATPSHGQQTPQYIPLSPNEFVIGKRDLDEAITAMDTRDERNFPFDSYLSSGSADLPKAPTRNRGSLAFSTSQATSGSVRDSFGISDSVELEAKISKASLHHVQQGSSSPKEKHNELEEGILPNSEAAGKGCDAFKGLHISTTETQ